MGVLVRFLKTLVATILVTYIGFAYAASDDSSSPSVFDFHFNSITKKDGLSDNTVTSVVEGPNGFIWAGTLNGLNRFNGYDVDTYFYDKDNPASIPNNFIRDLHVSENNELWVATFDGGVARYLPFSDNFQVFNKDNSALKTNEIWTIANDTDDGLIISTADGVYQYDSNTQTIEHLNPAIEFPKSIKAILSEPNRIWLGTTSEGAFIYDKKDKTLHSLAQANPWGMQVSALRVFDIKVLNGEYWLTTDNGYVRVDNFGNVVVTESAVLEDVSSSNGIRNITQSENYLWLTADKEVIFFSKESGRTLSLNSANSSITDLDSHNFVEVFADDKGGVWIATYNGLFYKDSPESPLPLYKLAISNENGNQSIWGIGEDSTGAVWFATQSNGLVKLISENGQQQHYLLNPNMAVWDLVVAQDDSIWLPTSDGLKVYKQQPDSSLTEVDQLLPNSYIERVYYDGQFIWFWDDELGIVSVNTDSSKNQTSKYAVSTFDWIEQQQIGVPFFRDKDKRLWISYGEETRVYDFDSKNYIAIPLQDLNFASILAVHEWNGFYWLTTANQGILQLDKLTLKPVDNFATENFGIAHSSIERNGTLWITTSEGIVFISLESKKVTGKLSNRELVFNSLNEGAALVTSNGSVFLGGTDGFHFAKFGKFKPSALSTAVSPPPRLLDLAVFGRKLTIDTDGPLKKPLYLTESLTLAYNDSRFSLSFGVTDPNFSRKVVYRYRMKSFDSDWTETDSDRTAHYNNVPFGSYVFQVQAKTKNSTWSPPTELSITIERPPWLHVNALFAYAFVVLVILLYLVRQYQARKANQLAIRESEERLKLTLWSSGDELWDWDIYRGQVFRSNTWGSLDFPQDNIRTNSAYDANIHANDISRVQTALREHLEGKTEFYELAYRARTFKNVWIWVLDRGKVVKRDHNGQPLRMTGTLKNIHHLKEAEEQLNLFKRSIENISEGVFITNTQFKFISVNNAYCNYTGETREQALASYMYFHQYPDAFTEEIKKALRTKGNWSGEVESVRINGERYEMELNIDAVHDEDGKMSHFVGVFSDITTRKSTEKELLKLANTDPLTDLANRSFYQASHNNLVRKGVPHALLCLDMDNFKKINDSLGHQTGDILIKQIAKRIQRMTGSNATCYRLGGDEFSVLLEELGDIHRITHFAQSLLDTLARPFIINKQEFVLGASVGIAFYPDDGATPQELLKNADTAMYFAKNNGGNSYQFFSGEMNQNAVRQLQIENLIRQGIKDDLFTVYYQPKVDIASGKLVSMEALVRFEHPQKGIVSPSQFIPLAEQTGQIIEIGEQVLRKACEDTKRWVSEGLFSGRVAVNISAKQFELPNLDDKIEQILRNVGLSPLHLECEITEGTLMESPEQALQMMERLREKGIHLALDDFGTGYSSLAYLKRFPLNTLKIDKAFIDDIAESSVDRHMAAAIINIAHNLGLKVVAEGVEYEKQLNILSRYDCEMIQGYLYSKPLTAEKFEKLLRDNQRLQHISSPASF